MTAVVVAENKIAAMELVSGARRFCERVVLAAVDNADIAVCADKAYYIECTGSRICCAGTVGDIVDKEDAQLVLVEQNIDSRAIAATLAARFETSVLTDCIGLEANGGRIESKKVAYCGKAVKTECSNTKSIVCVGAGVFSAGAETPCPVVEHMVCEGGGIKMLSQEPVKTRAVDLGAAKKIVAVGRGAASQEAMRLAEGLAKAIGAELACTRPIAEEERLMPKERYIGVSGQMVKPSLYIALGISGQIQHMAGVSGAGTVISINKDKKAPVFAQSDFGLVGDIADEVPKLIELLKRR